MNIFYRKFLTVLLTIIISLSINGQEFTADICIYGGTASGIMAAVAAAEENNAVIIVEPSRWLGGMIGGGIGILLDCEYPDEIGGLTKMVMGIDKKLGGDDRGLDRPLGSDPVGGRQYELRNYFVRLVNQNNIKVIYEHRLGIVEKEGNHITNIVLDYAPPEKDGCPAVIATKKNALQVKAKVFIDASYEGDLMARAGVSYVIGRESKDKYDESLAGQRNLQIFEISPYVDPADPASGLLPMIDPAPYKAGAASRHIIAYNFRFEFRSEGQGTPIGEPCRLDSGKYELVIRALKKDPDLISWPQYNYARHKLISSGIPGRQSDYPDADWAERAQIWREWIDHVKIMNKLTGSKQTLIKGQYPETNDFPHQLYIRMARRMVGEYIMTQYDLMLQTEIDNPVGLGYYRVDIYPCRLLATSDGKVASEGEAFTLVSPGPYQIPYGAITPEKDECGNLLVPVCISASHVALSSIRMEPTYMVMGESAGRAAVLALQENKDVQDIDKNKYRQALLTAGQILQWDGKEYGDRNGWWGNSDIWWKVHPEEYQKHPVDSILR